MGEPMRVRAVNNSGVVEVKVLMKHRMLSRLSWSTEGQLILPHFIQTLRGSCNGRPVLHVHLVDRWLVTRIFHLSSKAVRLATK